jgi:uncharacterized repeat protein (TIGR01451 family)
MEDNLDTGHIPKKRSMMRRVGSSSMALSVLLSQVTPALATIDNTASASGTYNAATTTSNTSTVNVPVAPAAPAMTVVKTVSVPPTIASGADATIADAGDKITFQYVVKNTGNVTIASVTPVDVGPKFNGIAGTGSMAAFSPAPVSLAPGISQTFTAVYTMSQIDVDRSAGVTSNVTNSATATGSTTATIPVVVNAPASTSQTTVPAGPKLLIAKSFILHDGGSGTAGKADVGETVDYIYTVTNTGNVAMTNVSIADTHVGVAVPAGTIINETLTSDGPLAPGTTSTDTVANNGIWSVLQPGATITFKWLGHVVTQAEFDAG